MLMDLPDWLIDLIWELTHPEDGCWRMTGEIAVGIVFVESSRRGGPTFGTAERSDICNEIFDGLNWLAASHPGGDLAGSTTCSSPGSTSPMAATTRSRGLLARPGHAAGQLRRQHLSAGPGPRWPTTARTCGSANRSDARDRDLRDAVRHPLARLRQQRSADDRHAATTGAAGAGARSTRSPRTRSSHLFGSADEYTGSGTPCSSCGSTHGCDRRPERQLRRLRAARRQDCVMDGNSHRLCGWTRGPDRLVARCSSSCAPPTCCGPAPTTTCGSTSGPLVRPGQPDIDDRERGNVQGYAIWAPWLRREDIKRDHDPQELRRVRRRLEAGAGSGLVPRRAHLRRRAPNQWLEDDHRHVDRLCLRSRRYVNSLRVRITTADVSWAGTDDDVSITLAGRTWNLDNAWHDDFERGAHRHLRPRPRHRPAALVDHPFGAQSTSRPTASPGLEAQGRPGHHQRLDALRQPGHQPLARGRLTHLGGDRLTATPQPGAQAGGVGARSRAACRVRWSRSAALVAARAATAYRSRRLGEVAGLLVEVCRDGGVPGHARVHGRRAP